MRQFPADLLLRKEKDTIVMYCDQASYDFTLTIGLTGADGKSTMIEIPLRELVAPQWHDMHLDNATTVTENGRDLCLVPVTSSYASGLTILGDPLYRSAYVFHNLDDKTISIAQPSFYTNDENIVPIGQGRTPQLHGIGKDSIDNGTVAVPASASSVQFPIGTPSPLPLSQPHPGCNSGSCSELRARSDSHLIAPSMLPRAATSLQSDGTTCFTAEGATMCAKFETVTIPTATVLEGQDTKATFTALVSTPETPKSHIGNPVTFGSPTTELTRQWLSSRFLEPNPLPSEDGVVEEVCREFHLQCEQLSRSDCEKCGHGVLHGHVEQCQEAGNQLLEHCPELLDDPASGTGLVRGPLPHSLSPSLSSLQTSATQVEVSSTVTSTLVRPKWPHHTLDSKPLQPRDEIREFCKLVHKECKQVSVPGCEMCVNASRRGHETHCNHIQEEIEHHCSKRESVDGDTFSPKKETTSHSNVLQPSMVDCVKYMDPHDYVSAGDCISCAFFGVACDKFESQLKRCKNEEMTQPLSRGHTRSTTATLTGSPSAQSLPALPFVESILLPSLSAIRPSFTSLVSKSPHSPSLVGSSVGRHVVTVPVSTTTVFVPNPETTMPTSVSLDTIDDSPHVNRLAERNEPWPCEGFADPIFQSACFVNITQCVLCDHRNMFCREFWDNLQECPRRAKVADYPGLIDKVFPTQSAALPQRSPSPTLTSGSIEVTTSLQHKKATREVEKPDWPCGRLWWQGHYRMSPLCHECDHYGRSCVKFLRRLEKRGYCGYISYFPGLMDKKDIRKLPDPKPCMASLIGRSPSSTSMPSTLEVSPGPQDIKAAGEVETSDWPCGRLEHLSGICSRKCHSCDHRGHHCVEFLRELEKRGFCSWVSALPGLMEKSSIKKLPDPKPCMA